MMMQRIARFAHRYSSASFQARETWCEEAIASLATVEPTESIAVPKIRLDGISQSFRSTNNGDLLALANINLQVRTGEFLCIVGPSGCGKSTLLHLIAGLARPTSGAVLQ